MQPIHIHKSHNNRPPAEGSHPAAAGCRQLAGVWCRLCSVVTQQTPSSMAHLVFSLMGPSLSPLIVCPSLGGWCGTPLGPAPLLSFGASWTTGTECTAEAMVQRLTDTDQQLQPTHPHLSTAGSCEAVTESKNITSAGEG